MNYTNSASVPPFAPVPHCPSAAANNKPVSMLQRFRDAKRDEIELLKKTRIRALPTPRAGRAFSKALTVKKIDGRSVVIAEYKKASPSRGELNSLLSPEEAARLYLNAGASALSVLTESRYFAGEIGFLRRMNGVGLPLLRKDFIFHPLQVEATLATPASAVLVIVRMLSDAELDDILGACGQYGLEAVCEIFSEPDLERLRTRKAAIVQVNNRDLETFKTDLELSRRLIAHKKPGEIWISASGYDKRPQIAAMEKLGFDAFLVGSSLMSSTDPAASLTALTGKRHPVNRVYRKLEAAFQ